MESLTADGAFEVQGTKEKADSRFSKCPKAYLGVFFNSADVAAGIPTRIVNTSLATVFKTADRKVGDY